MSMANFCYGQPIIVPPSLDAKSKEEIETILREWFLYYSAELLAWAIYNKTNIDFIREIKQTFDFDFYKVLEWDYRNVGYRGYKDNFKTYLMEFYSEYEEFWKDRVE